MADNRKEVERAELHRTIWAIADELRGSIDGWDFKSYILGMLFYRYISENITAYINKGEWETGNKSFNYADLADDVAEGAREEMVGVKVAISGQTNQKKSRLPMQPASSFISRSIRTGRRYLRGTDGA